MAVLREAERERERERDTYVVEIMDGVNGENSVVYSKIVSHGSQLWEN